VSFVDIPALICALTGSAVPSSWDSLPIGTRQYHLSHLFLPVSGSIPNPLNSNRWAVTRADGWKMLDTFGVIELYYLPNDPHEMFPMMNPIVRADLEAFYDTVVQ
jgi:hypothetical protein